MADYFGGLCPKCGRKSTWSKHYRSHVWYDADQDGIRLTCDTCGYSYFVYCQDHPKAGQEIVRGD